MSSFKPQIGSQIDRGHPLSKDLVGCWLFNEGSGPTVYDISGYDNHGVLTNMDPATDWVAGLHGWALEFDGNNDHVNLGDLAYLSSVSAFTISFWMNQDVIDVTDIIFIKAIDSSNRILIYTNADGKLYTHVCNGAAQQGTFDYSTIISAGIWAHFVCVFDGSGATAADRLKVYVDSSQQTLAFAGSTPVTTADLSGIDATISRSTNAFDGKLADFSIYNRALSLEDTKSLCRDPYAAIWTPGERKPAWTGAVEPPTPPALRTSVRAAGAHRRPVLPRPPQAVIPEDPRIDAALQDVYGKLPTGRVTAGEAGENGEKGDTGAAGAAGQDYTRTGRHVVHWAQGSRIRSNNYTTDGWQEEDNGAWVSARDDNINVDIALPVKPGDVITAWSLFCKGTADATGYLTAKLYRCVGPSADEVQVDNTQSTAQTATWQEIGETLGTPQTVATDELWWINVVAETAADNYPGVQAGTFTLQ